MTLLVVDHAGGSIGGVTGDSTTRAIETVFRIEFPRLVAGLARRVADVGLAEDLAQDALVGRDGAMAARRRSSQPGGVVDGGGQAKGRRPVPT